MENVGDGALPQFPAPPDGVARMEHLPTVEASIRYWEAVRVHASRTRQPQLEWTAMALRDSYMQVREALTNAEQSQQESTPLRARRGRLPRESSRDGEIKY